jgi:hypothetical protein
MNPDQRLDALFAAARDAAPETEAAEYAFETRLLARLREERGASWFGLALKLSPIFAALVIAAGAWFSAATSLETDATEYAWDAVRDGGTSALVAWLPETDR